MVDTGTWGTINPLLDKIFYREDPLSRNKIDALKPFKEERSNVGQPIRVVVKNDEWKVVMQGNHRVMAVLEQGLKSIPVILYTEAQWESFTEMPFIPGGTNNPRIVP